MALYAIAFDVHNQQNQVSIAAKLRKLGAVCTLESFWLLNSGNTTAQLRDELQTSIEYNDSLVIVELKAGAHWASRNAAEAGLDWMKRNLSP